MIKNKIITFLTLGTLVTSGVASGALISNKNVTTNKKTIQNHALLVAPNLNNLAVVINTNVNPLVLYSSPNLNSSIESYVSIGEMLNYTATSNPNFYKVTVQETGATGYISTNNMQIIQSGLNKAYENINKNGQVINVTYDVKLMSSPDVHSKILGSYKNNTPMIVLGKQDQWYKVKIGRQIGYMYQEYVGIDNSNVTANNSNVTANNSNVTANNSNVTANNSNVTANNSNVTANNSNVTANNSNIDSYYGTWIPSKIIGYQPVSTGITLSQIKSNLIINNKEISFNNISEPINKVSIIQISASDFENTTGGASLKEIGITENTTSALNTTVVGYIFKLSSTTLVADIDGAFVQFTLK